MWPHPPLFYIVKMCPPPLLKILNPPLIWYVPLDYTLRSNCQGLTLPPLLTPTVDTMYCDAVLIACRETSQFILCDTGSGDVQKSPIWDLGSVGGNVDEVEINTVSTTQYPAHSDILSSIDIFREVNIGEG